MVGATGRVGRRVVERLAAEGVPVRAVVRAGAATGAEGLADIPGVELRETDVSAASAEELDALVGGAAAVLALHGAARVSKASDAVRDGGRAEAGHPHAVNFRSVAALASACERNEVRKLVRVTGLSTGFAASAFHPLAVALNFVLSRTIRWQRAGERALQQSASLDYTVLRPGGLTDAPRPAGTRVAVSPDGAPSPPGATVRIGREDLADLVVLALGDERASRASLSVVWAKDGTDGGPKEALADARPDGSDAAARDPPYLLGMAAYGAVLASVLVAAVRGLLALVRWALGA